jgi:hypothetical protein
LLECGVAWFALSQDGWEAQSEDALRAEGVPVVRMGVDDAAGLFPTFDGDGLRFVLYEPEAGILRARVNATQALMEVALGAGARLVAGGARPAATPSSQTENASRPTGSSGPAVRGCRRSSRGWSTST